MSDLEGLDNISPKLSVPVQVQGKDFHAYGHLAARRVSGEKAWGGAGIFSRPVGCGNSVGMMESDDKKTLTRKKSHRNARRATKSSSGPTLPACSN